MAMCYWNCSWYNCFLSIYGAVYIIIYILFQFIHLLFLVNYCIGFYMVAVERQTQNREKMMAEAMKAMDSGSGTGENVWAGVQRRNIICNMCSVTLFWFHRASLAFLDVVSDSRGWFSHVNYNSYEGCLSVTLMK